MNDRESEDPKSSKEDACSHNPELDVCSDQFNPLRALYEPNYKVTDVVPKVLYQNLAAFESALKKFGIWQLNKRQKPEAGGGEGASKKAPSSRSVDILEAPLHIKLYGTLIIYVLCNKLECIRNNILEEPSERSLVPHVHHIVCLDLSWKPKTQMDAQSR